MKNVISLLRPQQWAKNFFVFLPLFFSGKISNTNLLLTTFIVFISFSFIASSIYCFNDIHDMNADRIHPKKCIRPIACGKISITQAYIIMVICISTSLLITFLWINNFISIYIIISSYFTLNILYSIKLKQIAIVDVFIIASGFVLRILAGGKATNIELSHWIILMTFLLALFLAFAKRKDDITIYEKTGTIVRKNIGQYNLQFMDQTLSIIASITVVCYIMYTVSDDVIKRLNSSYLYITSVWVLAGIIRYLQLTTVDMKSGNPTKILMTDRFIQYCISGWIISFIIILYI